MSGLTSALLRSPVTLSILTLALVVFGIEGPATDPTRFQSLPDLLRGIYRHGSLLHLLTNAGLLLGGGLVVEPRLGSWIVIFLAATAAITGTIAEGLISGGGFVGLSGLAYALASAALLLTRTSRQQFSATVLIALGLSAEWAFLRQDLAVYTHIAGATTGIVFAMFSSLFGAKGAQLKPMKWDHVAKVVPIIAETDEDDASEAEEVFLSRGFDNMLVLVEKGRILGLTGFDMDPLVPDVAWLSWTYLGRDHIGQGYGSQMFNDLLGMLNKQGVRKIFIETSDYAEDGKSIYAGAHRLYEEFGATLELTIPDYHAPGESKLIFGLLNPEAPDVEITPDNSAPGLALTGLDKAPEADAVAGLRWEEIPTGFSGADFALSNAREQGFRMAVLAVPSDISSAQGDALRAKGFRLVGQLTEYYGSGLGQDWWTHDLAS
ncbi:rhomboid family intramembrane serine protease [Sagittula sp. S175]|uniref:rhomboid family intramembrane serine protease n=1 Tax=Sagittula sp. S175 TaxID=3415129 RepID=UPI003C7E3679